MGLYVTCNTLLASHGEMQWETVALEHVVVKITSLPSLCNVHLYRVMGYRGMYLQFKSLADYYYIRIHRDGYRDQIVTRLHSVMWVCLCIPRRIHCSCCTAIAHAHSAVSELLVLQSLYVLLIKNFIMKQHPSIILQMR